jgi:hypothetical protein
MAPQRRHVLAIDIGGTHVILRVSESSSCAAIRLLADDDAPGSAAPDSWLVKHWTFDRVAIGFTGIVVDGRIVSEPVNQRDCRRR